MLIVELRLKLEFCIIYFCFKEVFCLQSWVLIAESRFTLELWIIYSGYVSQIKIDIFTTIITIITWKEKRTQCAQNSFLGNTKQNEKRSDIDLVWCYVGFARKHVICLFILKLYGIYINFCWNTYKVWPFEGD